MSVGATSMIPLDHKDDLWTSDEAWHITVDISNLEQIVTDLESEIGATVSKRAKRITPEKLFKIWSVDIEAARRTIRLTSQHIKYEASDHLCR